MTVNDLQRLYDYGCWANEQLLAVVSELTPEQLTGTVAGSYGSVRDTLVHMLSAEWGWLDRCGGHERGAALKADEFPNPESLRDAWARVEAWVRAFLVTLEDEDLDRLMAFKNSRGETRSMALGELLQHAANHGVHHRGQVALLLRELGHVPGNFDLLVYDASRHGVSAW
jgi:uncharacterized damage-inducible protein DinB